MSIITEMHRMRFHAIKAGCNITRWKISDDQAAELAGDLANLSYPPRFAADIYQSLRDGNCQMLGCLVVVH